MAWDNPDLQRYLRGLLTEHQERCSREAQRTIQKFHADSARAGLVSGVHLAYAAGGYANQLIYKPAVFTIEAFEQSCDALNLQRLESDYDLLLEEIKKTTNRQQQAAAGYLKRELFRALSTGDLLADVPSQVSNRAIRECARKIERLKLEAKHRERSSAVDLASQIAVALSEINTQAQLTLGMSLFRITELRVFADMGRAPKTPDELSLRLQALSVLIDQMDQKALKRALENANKTVPDGGLNRLEAVLALAGIKAVQAPLTVLRNLRRTRNLYPAHASSVEALQAAGRLGIDTKSEPARIWALCLTRCLKAVESLTEALARHLKSP